MTDAAKIWRGIRDVEALKDHAFVWKVAMTPSAYFNGLLAGFLEKERAGPAVINAGIYVLSRDLFARYTLPGTFSFEKDFLVPHVLELRPLAFCVTGLFIDIGTPDDFDRAQRLLLGRSEQIENR